MRRALLAGCLLALLAPGPAPAVDLQPVGTFDEPIFVSSPPGDSRLFVVERAGTIQVLHDGTWSEFLDIASLVRNTGEQGLLSMAFDPSFSSNGLFYVFFNGGSADPTIGDIHIDEFKVTADPNTVDPLTRRKVLTIVRGASGTTNHNGGQLQFGKDGYLYISVGDNANSANAQSTGSLHGKILRIDPHGATPGAFSVPADNPYVGVAGSDEIWSLGLRNPYRFSFDQATGDLAIGDVGASSFEEIDFSPGSVGLGRGANYGWPNCEGFAGSCPGTTLPVFAYPHTNPGGDEAYGCSIIGGYVYRGTQAPEIAGRYLYADLCTTQLRSIQLALPFAGSDRGESAPGALGGSFSLRSFGEDSACNLYVMNATTVYRIVGSDSSRPAACASSSAVPPQSSGPGTTFFVIKRKKCRKRFKLGHGLAVAAEKKRCKKRKRSP